MAPSYFPLRWESAGDQWWYASPIDFAAANGHYDLVSELLHLDTNLLIKLTSLRRIHRLETVWDDEEQFSDVAKCRGYVARRLLHECKTENGNSTLIRAGYGGWLLYTAASAGDLSFVGELLDGHPSLVFGEGEYGVTDILYAAARSKNSEVFRLLLNSSISLEVKEVLEGQLSGGNSEFRWEMMNRAIHAAVRGGNLEVLQDLIGDCSDVSVYRDAQGSTILHSSAGRGQVQVVKDIIASFDIVTRTDYQGNTALHVAAYRGHLAVVKVLIEASPSLVSVPNNFGDTFLHMAVSGFRTPGFRRVDKQVELMKQLVSGKLANIEEIINMSNNDGRTALHSAVIENIDSSLVELLMTVPSINLNIRDVNGMTPLDLLKQRPKSASSEILIKQLISAGGISNCKDNVARGSIASHLRGQGIITSPGTSFRISDGEIFLHTGFNNASDVSCNLANTDYSTCWSELSDCETPYSPNPRKSGSVTSAARRLKAFLQWPRSRDKNATNMDSGDNDSFDSYSLHKSMEDRPIPLRQRYSKKSLPFSCDKRTDSIRNDLPSPVTRMKFTAGLMHGVLQPSKPDQSRSPLSLFPGSATSSPMSFEQRNVSNSGPLYTNQPVKQQSRRHGSFNKKMNQYFCFGAQGLAVENSIAFTRPNQRIRRATSMMA